MISLDELRRREGFRFPGATVFVEPYENWLTRDVMLAPDLPPGICHPIQPFISATVGFGMSLDAVFALMGATAADGPMLGESDMEFHAMMREGHAYQVQGGITKVERKQGRRAGTFDIMHYRLEIMDGEDCVATISNTMIFPRGA